MKAENYRRVVHWSEEDQCFIGSCPAFVDLCCHGTNEDDVHQQLLTIIQEWIDIYKTDGKELPDSI